MAGIPLRFASNPCEHVRDLHNGTVRAEGIDFTFLRLQTPQVFYRFVRQYEWGVSGMALRVFAVCKLVAFRRRPDNVISAWGQR